MQSKFSITTRKTKNGQTFIVRFRNNETGEYLTARSVDRIALELGIRHHITKKPEAYQICEEAIKAELDGNTPKRDPYFIDYLKAFWTWETSPYVKRKLRKSENAISIGYVQNCYSNVIHHIESRLPKTLKCSQVKFAHIERIQDEILEIRSVSTWNNVFKAITAPVKELMRQRILLADPLIGIERYSDRTENPRGILTEAEVSQLIKRMESDYINGYEREATYHWRNGGKETRTIHEVMDRRIYLATCLAAVTGMRLGEILALTTGSIYTPPTQVENPQAIVTISQAYAKDGGMKCPKGKKTRCVTIPKWLADDLTEFGDSNPTGTGYIFYSAKDPQTVISESYVLQQFYKALERIGIKEAERTKRNIVFHSLRHYANTRTTELLGQSEAMRRIGHEDKGTSERYMHVRNEHLIETGCKLVELIPSPTTLRLVVNE